MRIAALDLGSNSFHLVVVEAHADGTFRSLATDKEMLRLGDAVARTGRIGEANATAALAVVLRFKALADAHRAEEIVACGTAALREAEDGVEFVEHVRQRSGIKVEVLDGLREARLIFNAVRSSVLIDRPPALVTDLGGGSLELAVGDPSSLDFAASLRIGVGRLTAQYLRSDPPTKKEYARLEEAIRAELAPVLEEVRNLSPRMLIGSSGTFVSLARMAAAERDGRLPATVNQLSVNRSDLETVALSALSLRSSERAKLPGCDARRAELVPAGIAVLFALMEGTGLARLTVSEWALREGMVLEAIGHHDRAELDGDPRAIRRASVLSLCRRSNWRQGHARQVADLSLELFDETKALHGLSNDDRELLELGALAHDIGEHVSRTNHDRHSAYLIEHGELRGFSPSEIRILSCLGRFHLRGSGFKGHPAYAALDELDRSRTLLLLAILRVADALDAAHGRAVRHVTVDDAEPGELALTVEALGDAELEQWAVRKKKELFEKTFGCKLSLSVKSVGPGIYEVGGAAGLG